MTDMQQTLNGVLNACTKYTKEGNVAVVPGRMGIGIYSPALDGKGNSVAGIKALELLSSKLDLSIF